MGFLSIAFNLPKVIVISMLIEMLCQLKLVVTTAFTRLGLLKPVEEDNNSWESSNNYVLLLDGSSPSLVPIPVRVVTASIKKRLPVVPYLKSTSEEEESGGKGKGKGKADNDESCAVCLESLETNHEIRELFNCCHVFHRLCLDTWVDEGQITCPLCRSMLLPSNVNLNLLRSCGHGDHGGEEDRVR